MEAKKQTKKKEPWIKPRHKLFQSILRAILGPYSAWKYGVQADPFLEQGDRPYLIMMNHQTPFDQFFIGMSFKGPVYYIATEDIFSKGWISSVIRYLVAPVPIKKQTTDLHAVMTCMKIAKEGGTIALAPEGNRTFSGKTEYIKPSIVKFARALKLPIAIYRIEGGYGVQPRWSDSVRKGSMHAYVSRVIEQDEIKELSDDELYELLLKELYVNEGVADGTYRHPKLAEYLERAMYVCPHCGLSEFESSGDIIRCKQCGQSIRYLPTKELEGIDRPFPFRFVTEWYDYQCDFINNWDPRLYQEKPLYQDTARLSEVILYKNKRPLRNQVSVALYGNRITIDDDLVFLFDETAAVTVLGRNKVNIYFGDTVYQLKSDKRFNALKYVNIFNRYKNIREGNENGKFLGL